MAFPTLNQYEVVLIFETDTLTLFAEHCATLPLHLATVRVGVCAAVRVAVTAALTVARQAGTLKTMSGTIMTAQGVQLAPAVVTPRMTGTITHLRMSPGAVAPLFKRVSSPLLVAARRRDQLVPPVR